MDEKMNPSTFFSLDQPSSARQTTRRIQLDGVRPRVEMEQLVEEVPKSSTWGSTGLRLFSVKPYTSL